MKNLETGESSGEPLAHDEWVKAQQREWKSDPKYKGGAATATRTPEEELEDMRVTELREKAKALGVDSTSTLNKDELVKAIEREEKKAAKK